MPGGQHTYCNYGFEAVAFKTEAAAINKTFGQGVRVSAQDARRNLQRIFGLGSRNASAMVEGRFEGALTVDFELASPWWLRGVMGSVTSGGAGPYDHTFSEANAPPSMTIESGIDLTTDAVIHYLGSLANECTITFEEGAPAHVSLSFVYASELKATSGLGSQVAETEVPFNMGYCSLEVPDATAIADTRRAELRITNNAALYWGLGSVLAGQYVMGQRTYDLTTVNYFDDASAYLEKLYGQAASPTVPASSIATIEMLATNSAATTSERTYSIILTTAKVNSHSLPRQMEEALYETAEIQALSGSIVVTNNTETPPADA